VTVLAQTVEAWWPQILAFIETSITNAATDANNELVKDAARIVSGFRNLKTSAAEYGCTANGTRSTC
jgi:transposase